MLLPTIKNILGTITPHYQLHNLIHGYIKVVRTHYVRMSGVGGLSTMMVLSALGSDTYKISPHHKCMKSTYC